MTEDDPEALLRLVEEISEECTALLRDAGEVDWAATRKVHMRPGDEPQDVPAAYAILHGLEHLGEHVAHCSLTRQLWEAR